MNLPRLKELTSSDERQVNGLTRRLAQAGDRQELAALFIDGIGRCLPGEMSGWGETTPDFTTFTGMTVSEPYFDATQRLMGPIAAYLDHHPALRAVGWSGARKRPHRISDFASSGQFRATPLYREAYRHLDADHQVAFSPGCFDGTGIVISLNRKQTDYSDRECQKFHMLGNRVSQLLHDLTERHRINRQLRLLEARWPLAPAGSDRLTAGELRHLGRLARQARAGDSRVVNKPLRDTHRKALYAIMDKLELESRTQLVAILRELRP
ncbi:MAG: hypothetical protein ACFE0O_15025 [Opitutales bacterium]